MRADRYRQDPAAFIDAFIKRNEKGTSWSLSVHQRLAVALAFRFGPTGRLLLRLLLWSEPKKSGKTFLAACLGLWWAFTRPHAEIIVAANDLEQSVSRVFATMVKLCEHNAELRRSVRVKATEIVVSNGTLIKAVPRDYRGEAGSRHSLAIFDELWGFDSERAQRMFEEMTPIPTEPDAWILVVTLAGFSGESVLLERLYRRGLTGERLDSDLEVYRADDLLMFWSHTARQPWQTDAYYAEQERLLRPNTFRRLHRNEWTIAESAFITPELWDPCVEAERRPMLTSNDLPVFGGIDGSVSGDTAATAFVAWQNDKLVLVRHCIWRPSKADPLDIERTIEADLRETHQRFRLQRVLADPYQLHRSVTTLKAAGIAVEGFAQTQANTSRMGGVLFELLKTGSLLLYPDAELRQQALNTAAVESPFGFRIAKQTGARKIDAIAALAMACVAALEAGPTAYVPQGLLFSGLPADFLTAEIEQEIEAALDAVCGPREGA
jgi:phage terminase large subunit-like protein